MKRGSLQGNLSDQRHGQIQDQVWATWTMNGNRPVGESFIGTTEYLIHSQERLRVLAMAIQP